MSAFGQHFPIVKICLELLYSLLSNVIYIIKRSTKPLKPHSTQNSGLIHLRLVTSFLVHFYKQNL